MNTTLQIIAQEVNSKTGEVIQERKVFNKKIDFPKNIQALGFNHKEQIEILQESQGALLDAQQERINEFQSTCPNCGKKTTKQGKFKSDFHSVFTDHEVTLQRTRCQCDWRSKISIDGLYGSALHPDLVELQSQFGSETSFKKTGFLLTARCKGKRAINNHSRIQKTVQQVGELLLTVKLNSQWVNSAANDSVSSDELVLVIDGAHLHSSDKNKRFFEAITATAYNPKKRVRKDKHHNKIEKKTVVASAKQDKQKNIKQLTLHACIKEGLKKDTHVTVLTDGAKNCWSIISSLTSACHTITTILDWFHIGKKFKNSEHNIPEELKEEFNKAKGCLWHGNPTKSLTKLKNLQVMIGEEKAKLSGLITYIKNNKQHIINYQEREKQGLTFTSQLAESIVNNLVNVRQKHDARMQWSRTGADCILQIRSSKQSNNWDTDWVRAQELMYREAI